MAAKAKTISLRDLHQHVKALDKLVTDAWMGKDHPAGISYREVRELAAKISALVADDAPSSPHAATATKSPKAAADNDKADVEKRAEYRRAAADKKPFDAATLYKPAFDPAVLGLAHIRKS